jgi:hypothetical protein
MSVRLMAMVWDMDMKAVDKIILLALADYADDDGVCWPKQGTVAIKTGVTRQTVNQKMKQMEESGVLEKKDGRTILFPVKEADTIVGETDTPKCQGDRQESRVDRQGCQGGRHPSKPSTNHQLTTKDNFQNQAEEIYAEYPRNVGKAKAIPSIISALKKAKDFSRVLARTKQFAELTADREREFIPHPTTWFNQHRYNDNPDEWMSKEARGAEVEKLEHQLAYERDPEKFEELKAEIKKLR